MNVFKSENNLNSPILKHNRRNKTVEYNNNSQTMLHSQLFESTKTRLTHIVKETQWLPSSDIGVKLLTTAILGH